MIEHIRRVFHSEPAGERGWKVTVDGEVISYHRNQVLSEGAVRRVTREVAREGERIVRVLFHRPDGSVREEQTYTTKRADPRISDA